MKKLVCLLLSLLLLCGVSALSEALPAETLFTPGTYEASAQGMIVPIKVTITVTETEIVDVVVDATGETDSLGGAAATKLAKAMLKEQTPHVDTLSGATVSSKGIIGAAEQALLAAGANLAVLDANRRTVDANVLRVEETVDTDIVRGLD